MAGSVEAQIVSITSTISTGALQFTDTHSLNPSLNPGSTYFAASAGWTGAPVTLSQTDPTTFDAAGGILDASGYGGNNYPITLNNISLSQAVGNTGHADLQVGFVITYQIGAGGLPGGLAQYPNLLVSGTVQPAAGSYASVVGNISYFAVNAAGVFVTSAVPSLTTSWTTPRAVHLIILPFLQLRFPPSPHCQPSARWKWTDLLPSRWIRPA